MKCLVFAVCAASAVHATTMDREVASVGANPIRKAVTMLQNMQKKVEEEAVKEKALYEKYMCWCKTGGHDLGKSIASANTKVPELQSSIEEAEGKLAQLKEDLVSHRADRAAAKDAMAKASGIREKEAAAFAKEKADLDANIDALTKAIAALERGMAGGFLQTSAAQVLRRLMLARAEMLDGDRQEVLAFLSQGSDYAPQSGEIVGILKQLKDEMSKDRADAVGAENSAIATYKGLMSAKAKEVAALTKSIEEKTVRVGELGVSIAEMKNDLTDTEEALIEDKKFLADLEKDCATKTKEWEEVIRTRSQELLAIAEAIKILNSDDALELFKKTLPSPAASLVQMSARSAVLRARALAMIRQSQRSSGPSGRQLDFIVLALSGKKIGFEKVIKMIDDMVKNLKKEQTDDDNKKEYCGVQLDSTDDQKKSLERSVADLETAIANAEEGISTLASEIEALKEGIVALDKSVAEATEQRRAENAEFKDRMAQDSAAKEVIGLAINRLNKFYNPKLHKPSPKRELSEEERITVNMGGTLAPTSAPGGISGTGVTVLAQVKAHVQRKDAPPPPPEAVGAYKKKSEESTGVIAMLKLLVTDLDKDMAVAETEEKDAQSDYEQMTSDAAAKRAGDSKSLTEKEGAKADLEADLQSHKDEKKSTVSELGATLKVIHSLHQECDWLLKYFDARREARDGEIDALQKAKAVLSGADYSLLQTRAGNLRGQS